MLLRLSRLPMNSLFPVLNDIKPCMQVYNLNFNTKSKNNFVMWKKPRFWKRKSKKEVKHLSDWMTGLVKSRNKSMTYSVETAMRSLKPFTVCGFKSTEIKIVLKMPNKQILMIMKNLRYHLNATMKRPMLSNCCLQKSKPVRLNLKNARECWLKHNLRKMKCVHFSKVQVKPMRNLTGH